jgi:hypothetical protein
VPTLHEYFAYDGCLGIGRIVMKGERGEARAFDANGKSLGRFANARRAFRAISAAHRPRSVERTAAARQRLLEPVQFASGLPEHFIERAPAKSRRSTTARAL